MTAREQWIVFSVLAILHNNPSKLFSMMTSGQ